MRTDQPHAGVEAPAARGHEPLVFDVRDAPGADVWDPAAVPRPVWRPCATGPRRPGPCTPVTVWSRASGADRNRT
ncbi:hypothetical protein GCM10023083_08640 [Streptomyces phyllanthi]